MLGGTLQSFRQLKPLTHICASDHSNFYLSLVGHIASISHEYVFIGSNNDKHIVKIDDNIRMLSESWLSRVGFPVSSGSITRMTNKSVRLKVCMLSAISGTFLGRPPYAHSWDLG
jgi:hypothetical protein